MTANFVLGVVGSAVTLVLLFEMMRRHRLREKYAVFWALVAFFTLVIAVYPRSLSWLAGLVGVEVPTNLLFFLASMLLLVVSIQHSHELGRLEERTRTLAEEVALLRMEQEMRPAVTSKDTPDIGRALSGTSGRGNRRHPDDR